MNEKFYALLVGIPRYIDESIEDLPFIENDLREVEQALRGLHYNVTVQPPDQTDQQSVDQAIEFFLTKAGRDSTLLLFLSGHGVHHAGVDYLVPSGARTISAKFPERCVPIKFDEYVESSPASNIVIMIDACREGIHLREKGINVASWSDREVMRSEKRKFAYFYACSRGQQAWYSGGDGASQFSFFSRALTQVLAGSRGQLTFSRVEKEVQKVLDHLVQEYERPSQRVKILTDMSEHDKEAFVIATTSHAQAEPTQWTAELRRDRIHFRAGVRAVKFSPDGKLLASGTHDMRVVISHIDENGSATRHYPIRYGHIPLHRSVLAVDFSSDNGVLAAAGNDWRLKCYRLGAWNGPVLTYDLRYDRRPHEGPISALAFSTDGEVLVSGSHDASFIVWNTDDPANPQKVASRTEHEGHINTLGFGAGTRILATGSSDTSVILWDLSDRGMPQRIATLKGHSAEVRALALTSDARTLATGGVDCELIIWDLSDLSRPARRSTTPCSTSILAIEFHPCMEMLATGHFDGSVILWDLTDASQPRQSTTLSKHSERVRAVSFAPDGKTLATAGRDGNVLLWNIQRRQD